MLDERREIVEMGGFSAESCLKAEDWSGVIHSAPRPDGDLTHQLTNPRRREWNVLEQLGSLLRANPFPQLLHHRPVHVPLADPTARCWRLSCATTASRDCRSDG